ncbi:MAG: hypothetical protein FJ278_11120, partial [Planctomycetes bacterium]|nr:hypothetical protein [Planctomycetota bacterium]
MRKCAWLCLLWAVASTSAAEPVPPPGAVVLRVRFGMKDQEPTDWSGTIAVTPGRVLDIRGWRWTPADFAEGNAWTVQTRRLPPMDSVQRKRVEEGKITMPIGDNGVVITLADTQPSSDIEIAAKPGTVAFKLSEIPYGQRLQRLEGNLEIERAPAVMPIAQTDADEDCPSAVVGKDGTLYVAHVAFMRGQDFLKGRERVATPEQPNVAPWPNAPAPRIIAKPEDFDYLAQKTGGEQVWLRPCKNGAWGDPIAVTDAGGEFYKTALAVDGTGRVWVFYSAHLNADANGDHGNWESLARSVAPNGQLSPVVNISNAPGPDFAPAAATDADGKVWVTWMAGRGASFDIFAAQQSGDRFSTPLPIAATNANEWDPAIAADKRGNLAIAWDSYQKGDYDVYLALRGVGGKFGEPMPVAATLNFEVRPSLAYDGEGQLWVAWEQGDENWGKDFGPLKKQGIAIFQGRSLGVKVLRNRTEWLAPPDVMLAMPNLPRVGGRAGQAGKAAKAPPGKGQLQQAAPSFPRLATDAQG